MSTQPLIRRSLDLTELLDGGTFTSVPGTRVGVAQAEVKRVGLVRDDIAVLVATGLAAGVVTRSTALAAPCRWTRARLPGPVTALVVNSGNANAATGTQGEADAQHMAETVAQELGCAATSVLVCSTGVIGVPMPMARVKAGIVRAVASLGSVDGHRAARAIMTTDLVPKEAACAVDGVTVGGIAKGSGMIHPDMATMLAFLVTDARIAPEHATALQALVTTVADRTFHAVTVDGDMSTNDTFVVQSTGVGPTAAPGTPMWVALERALHAVARHLARAMARDGEGARHLIEVIVEGTADDATARMAARTVARSPLVKTAIAGHDANWGRVLGALGAAGVAALERCDLDFAGVPVLRDGAPLPFDEARARAALSEPTVTIAARLPGPGYGEAFGCDLTADYVRINADYRT